MIILVAYLEQKPKEEDRCRKVHFSRIVRQDDDQNENYGKCQDLSKCLVQSMQCLFIFIFVVYGLLSIFGHEIDAPSGGL